jgi:hypothetical protein
MVLLSVLRSRQWHQSRITPEFDGNLILQLFQSCYFETTMHVTCKTCKHHRRQILTQVLLLIASLNTESATANICTFKTAVKGLEIPVWEWKQPMMVVCHFVLTGCLHDIGHKGLNAKICFGVRTVWINGSHWINPKPNFPLLLYMIRLQGFAASLSFMAFSIVPSTKPN